MSSREIWQEDQEKRQVRDTEEKIAVFHVTENSESVYFSMAESLELLQTAGPSAKLPIRQKVDTKFVSTFPRREKITQEQFDTAAAERMENTGCISGAYELDFDARTFSALNIMDGWKAYAIDDIAAAAEAAFQESEISEDDRWRIFLDRLDGQELTAARQTHCTEFLFRGYH